MDATEALKAAWAAVEGSGVPKELEQLAFERALDIVLATDSLARSPAPPPRDHTPTPPTHSPTGLSTAAVDGNDEDAFYTQLTAKTTVLRETLERFVHLEDGEPRVALNSKDLPGGKTGKKANQLFIARVILTTRSAWLDESEVLLATVRNECDHFGCLDGNFSTNMKSLNGDGITISGSARQQKAKVRKNYIDGFADFVAQHSSTGE